MVFIQALLCVTLTTAVAATSWDDFANNLATDLTPILQLFGEQVTKQYLAESISTLDCIIFAIAPLGILTTIVSAIRICGDSTLKAFVGRGQESSGLGELELCSSTGRDILELYQGGGITRVFGRGKTLEIIHDPSLEEEILGDGSTPTRGIYTLMGYQQREKNGKNWVPSSWPSDMAEAMNGLSDEDKRDRIVKRLGHAQNPNLMLNIGLRRHPKGRLICIAILGAALQASMLGFAGWATFVEKLRKEDAMPPPWALSMTAIGTTLLCVGTFMCSYLIERSTHECTFKRDSSSTTSSPPSNPDPEIATSSDGKNCSTLYWVQPGDQVIGDQTFDSFAYSDKKQPLSSYTMSWRKKPSQLERTMTWVASFVTIIAFIIQFIGLRGLHSSVQVYQLAVVLIMSGVRAFLRINRLDLDDNLFYSSSKNQKRTDKEMPEETQMDLDLRGHELDRLAFELSKSRPGGNVLTWNLAHTGAENGAAGTLDAQQNPNDGLTRPWTEKELLPSTLVWHYRVRLAQLTLDTSQENLSQAWPDTLVKGRLESRNTAQAISATVSFLLPKNRWYFNRISQTSKHIWLDLTCSCLPNKEPQDETPAAPLTISFSIPLSQDLLGEKKSLWSVNPADIEAAVSLTHYSCVSNRRALKPPSSLLAAAEPLSMRRIIAASADHSTDAAKNSVALIELWACFPHNQLGSVEYITLESVNTTAGLTTLWTKPTPSSGVYSPTFRKGLGGIQQFCGWPVMPQINTLSERTYMVATCEAPQPLMTLCTQEIFAVFLHGLSTSAQSFSSHPRFTNEGGHTGIQHDEVDKLIELFTENDLGSRTDAMLCIIPIIAANWSQKYISNLFSDMLGYMAKSVSRGAMTREQCQVLLWGKRCMAFGLRDQQVWDWFLTSAWHCYEFSGMKKETYFDYPLNLRDLSTDLPTSDETHSRIDRLMERLCIDPNYKEAVEPIVLERGKSYGNLRSCTISDCVKDDDPYGALILAYQILDEQVTVELETIDKLAGQIRRPGDHWLLVASEIRKRRDIFAACDEKGRNAFFRACLANDLDAAKCISKFSAGQYEANTDTKGWHALHHMIAENNKEAIMSLNLVEYSPKTDRFGEALFEALESDKVNIDEMIICLQTKWKLGYQMVRNRFDRYTIPMSMGLEKDRGESWRKGLRRVYAYEQKLKLGSAATATGL
ncbi:hypothetical protein FB567DRAFT_607902 [Paraphoma chrysanthemicola]|uniref:Ankyrin repeat protein n=1 Tax=Paraphoma chrysanthemicola TaxID=798071 RepID=A0A8K0VUQ4_9PLEO|nr:hypothetical protein FB567DRAFT_607902 [Paraphoma chrysanthemicola]